MKKLFLICLLCLTAFEVVAQTANVYIMRKSLIGAVYKFPIEVNSVQIGKIASKKYFVCTVPAGEVTVSTMLENGDKITFNAMPGQNYYILVNASIGVLTARPNLSRIDAVEGSSILGKLKQDKALTINSNGDILPMGAPIQMGSQQPVYASTQPMQQPVQSMATVPTTNLATPNTVLLNGAKEHYERTKHLLVNIMQRQSELLLSSSDREELGTINNILSQCNNKLYTLGKTAPANKPDDAVAINKVEGVLSSLDKRLDMKYGQFLATASPQNQVQQPAPQPVQQPAYQQPAYQQPAYQQQPAPQPMYQQPAQQPQVAAQAGRNSDVDINIPVTGKKAPNTFVLIIANENYEFVDDVQYAINDGEAFREYCIKTLGVPERQVWFYKDASAGIISGGVDKMMQAMNIFNNAKAIVYYCGHGIPDEKTGDAYLVPTDGRGTNVATCYSLNKLYKTLSSNPSTQVTYFMDACFTGANRNGSMLVAARGVAREAKKEVVKGNTVVFSAASGDETAMPFKEKQHGLFTYFLLKKLQESKGEISYGDLADYIRDNVKKEAFLTNEKPQNPVVATSEASVATWRNYKM